MKLAILKWCKTPEHHQVNNTTCHEFLTSASSICTMMAVLFPHCVSCAVWNEILSRSFNGKSSFAVLGTIRGTCCGCRSGRNVSHYTAPSRFCTNTPQSVIVENPGSTANEMKLWIFKLFHSLQFNNEQLLESWRTEFPFCERAKRRWRVGAGNGKQTLHILHLLRSLVVCRLKQVCLQNGVHVWGCVCSLVCVWGPVWPLECLKLIEQREKKEGHRREENLCFVLVLKNWRTFIKKKLSVASEGLSGT